MKLTVAPVGAQLVLESLNCDSAQMRQLENLGFVVGVSLEVVQREQGSVIVSVMNSRVALGKELAKLINVNPVSASGL